MNITVVYPKHALTPLHRKPLSGSARPTPTLMRPATKGLCRYGTFTCADAMAKILKCRSFRGGGNLVQVPPCTHLPAKPTRHRHHRPRQRRPPQQTPVPPQPPVYLFSRHPLQWPIPLGRPQRQCRPRWWPAGPRTPMLSRLL